MSKDDEFVFPSATADVMARNSRGQIPLHQAAMDGHVGVAMCLLDAGAEIMALDDYDLSALHWAIESGSVELVKLFLGKGAVDTKMGGVNEGALALHTAARLEHVDILLLLLLKEPTNINATTTRLQTPLHFAAQAGKTLAAKVLLEHGADVSAKDNCGDTPLHATTKYGKYGNNGLALALLDSGADPMAVNISGRTPIEEAGAKANALWVFQDVLLTLLIAEYMRSKQPNLGPDLSWENIVSQFTVVDVENERHALSEICCSHQSGHIISHGAGRALWNLAKFPSAIVLFEISMEIDPVNKSVIQVESLSHDLGRICDDCRQSLKGIRYYCTVCEDFDLCTQCYAKPIRFRHESTELNHEFLQIPTDAWVTEFLRLKHSNDAKRYPIDVVKEDTTISVEEIELSTISISA